MSDEAKLREDNAAMRYLLQQLWEAARVYRMRPDGPWRDEYLTDHALRVARLWGERRGPE